jgi:hypothetical protein
MRCLVQAQRGDGYIPPILSQTGARRWWVVSAALQTLNFGKGGGGRRTEREKRESFYPSCRWLGGPRVPSGRHGKSRLHQDSIPGPSNPYRVAIPTYTTPAFKLTVKIINICFFYIPVPCILYYLQFDQRLHSYIKHNNYE